MAYQFECRAPDCVFLIRAADETEVLDQVERHAREFHDKPADLERVRSHMERVDVE